MKKETSEMLDTIQKGRPFIRAALAFILYLRFSTDVDDYGTKTAYMEADDFINQLEKDVEQLG